MEATIYTAHYIDHEIPSLITHAMVFSIGDQKKIYRTDSKTDTYMDIRLRALADYFDKVLDMVENNHRNGVEDIYAFTIHGCNSNFNKIGLKLNAVYRSLKDFPINDAMELLDMKLRRSNKSRYRHHDLQMRLMTALLKINQFGMLELKFKPCSNSFQDMTTAYQAAELHHGKLCSASNVIPLHR